MASKRTITASYNGETVTRTTAAAYTHATFYICWDGVSTHTTFHKTEAAAMKGGATERKCGWKIVAVVEVSDPWAATEETEVVEEAPEAPEAPAPEAPATEAPATEAPATEAPEAPADDTRPLPTRTELANADVAILAADDAGLPYMTMLGMYAALKNNWNIDLTLCDGIEPNGECCSARPEDAVWALVSKWKDQELIRDFFEKIDGKWYSVRTTRN